MPLVAVFVLPRNYYSCASSQYRIVITEEKRALTATVLNINFIKNSQWEMWCVSVYDRVFGTQTLGWLGLGE